MDESIKMDEFIKIKIPRENSTKRLVLSALQNPNIASIDEVANFVLTKRPELQYGTVLNQAKSIITQMKKGNMLVNKYKFLEDGLHIVPIVAEPKVV